MANLLDAINNLSTEDRYDLFHYSISISIEVKTKDNSNVSYFDGVGLNRKYQIKRKFYERWKRIFKKEKDFKTMVIYCGQGEYRSRFIMMRAKRLKDGSIIFDERKPKPSLLKRLVLAKL
ncbi:MAG: hypothetical protein ACFFDH_00250 [Promethearchaeota archaeon]